MIRLPSSKLTACYGSHGPWLVRGYLARENGDIFPFATRSRTVTVYQRVKLMGIVAMMVDDLFESTMATDIQFNDFVDLCIRVMAQWIHVIYGNTLLR